MNSKAYSGLVAAPFTPFGPDGRLDLAKIPMLSASLRMNGVVGAFVCGTTGEGSSLTLGERKLVTEAWIRARPKGFSVIAHVGHNCLADASDLAQHAASAGADAIGMIAPSFFRPATLEHLVDACEKVAQAAPDLPFYYYHMPLMTGVDFSMASFLEAASGRIPNLGGVKFTHNDLMDYGRTLSVAAGRYTVFFGRDEILLSALALGANAAVGSSYNFMAPIYQRVIAAFSAGDMAGARREQAKAVGILTILVRNGGMAGFKAAMKMIGLDCGDVRLPLRGLGQAEERKLRSELEREGFFDADSHS